MLVALFACEKDTPTPPASVESMQFEGVSTTLDEGESINLSQYLTITPEAVGDTVTVEWSSSDETVATVSASGSVETLKAGSVTITAKAMDKTATISITIGSHRGKWQRRRCTPGRADPTDGIRGSVCGCGSG